MGGGGSGKGGRGAIIKYFVTNKIKHQLLKIDLNFPNNLLKTIYLRDWSELYILRLEKQVIMRWGGWGGEGGLIHILASELRHQKYSELTY